METSARLLRLLSLLQARPDWTGAELAHRLHITARTLRRDVQKLRSLGYPVGATPGVAGGYRLGAGAALPPLLLEDDEAVAVVLGLRTAASHSVTGVVEASVRALAKLEQVLPARLRERTAALGQATVPLAVAGPAVDAEALTMIARACRNRERLRFDYQSRDGGPAERSAEPHRLVQAGNRWYLVARDTGLGDWRTFRVDRISAVRQTGARFVPRDPPDAAAFVSRSVSVAPYRYQARVLVRAPAEEVADLVPPTAGVVEPAGPGTCILSSGGNDLGWMAMHLATMGHEFNVLEPPELIEQVKALAGRLQRASVQHIPAKTGRSGR
jgi:predicted DNA-binding transcriptional regulator YafY